MSETIIKQRKLKSDKSIIGARDNEYSIGSRKV